MDDHAVLLPSGVDYPEPQHEPGVLPTGPQRGAIVNETDLPDGVVHAAVETFFEEHASMLGANSTTSFQRYTNEGSLLARAKFRVPRSTIEEICLARDLAERDDDVGATMGAMLAIAMGDGMRHTHEDEVAVALFDEAIGKYAGLDAVLMEMYRELLISSSVTTVQIFTRTSIPFKPQGAERTRTRDIVAPLIGVLPAEQIRVLEEDLFGKGVLALKPATGAQERWLKEFFASSTSPARKADMRRDNPVLAAMVLAERHITEDDYTLSPQEDDPAYGNEVYILNPRMVARTTFPKGSWKYPRPLLTRNFALLEAKRLLNLMDFALLQGGSNFLVIAKKGDKDRPAMPEEIANLREQVRRSSYSGVMVGDHRLSIEIVTPELTELLNPTKRKLLGRRIAMGLLRLPEYAEADSGAGQVVLSDTEIIGRVISSDRRYLRRHLEQHVYDEFVRRNPAAFAGTKAATIWFPKIILQGTQYFTDMVLKLRDRGDISRHSAVAVAGFDYDAEVQQRKLEKPQDRIMTAPVVPFTGQGGPNGPDNQGGGGRPPGGSSNNGTGNQPPRSTTDRTKPRTTITRTAGETVRAMYDETADMTFRMGEITSAIIEQFEAAEWGRVSRAERTALDRIANGEVDQFVENAIHVIPVNLAHAVDNERLLRLAPGVSMVVGDTHESAMVAKALFFRAPDFTQLTAQETAITWGYDPTPVPT